MWEQIFNKIEKIAEHKEALKTSPWPKEFLCKMGGSMIQFDNEYDKDLMKVAVATLLDSDETISLHGSDNQDDLLFKAAQLCDVYKESKRKEQ